MPKLGIKCSKPVARGFKSLYFDPEEGKVYMDREKKLFYGFGRLSEDSKTMEVWT